MQQTQILQQTMTADESAIVRCVLYFSIFNYPLTCGEIFEKSAVHCGKEAIAAIVQSLVERGLLQRQGEYYLAFDADNSAVTKRMKGNAGAERIMTTAMRYSRRIASFPFVKGICLSGALSKNYYDEKGDIDYFIIAEPGRLWICRSLLILWYKFLPANRKKFWCVNYFVSTDSLLIPEQNAFTGTEMAHLIPTYNYSLYTKLLEKNTWYRGSFPNKDILTDRYCVSAAAPRLKRFGELIFSMGGGLLDDLLLRATLKRWKKKFPSLPAGDFELQFRSRKNVCKRHTIGFQDKVLGRWKEKQEALERRYQINLA